MERLLSFIEENFGRRWLGVFALLGMLLAMNLAGRTVQEFGRQIAAQPLQDLSQDIAFFHSREVSEVAAFSGDADRMLIGGGTQGASLRDPKLALYENGLLTNLSSRLRNFSGATIEAIASDGSSWLIGGGNPSSFTMTPKLNRYDGAVFSDLSNLLEAYQGRVQTIGWNGEYWLLGINTPGSRQNEGNVLLRYDGQTITEIATSATLPALRGADIVDIAWNGEYWLVAYENGPETKAPEMYELPESRLLRYDGETITELHPTSFVQYSVLDADWNDREWLVSVYVMGAGTDLLLYDGEMFRGVPVALPEGLIGISVEWTGEYWIVGTVSEYANFESGLAASPQFIENVRAVQFWKFDGGEVTPLEDFPTGVLLNTLFFEEESRQLFIGGIGENFKALFAAQTLEATPSFTDGTLVRAAGRPEVFVIYKNRKKHVPGPEVFAGYNYRAENIQEVSQGILAAIPDVKLIRAGGDPRVFHLARGQKRWIRTEEVFNSYGFSWEDIMTVNAIDLAAYRTTSLLRVHGEEAVYVISESGVRRHIPNPESFNSYGYRWEDIVEIQTPELYSYEPGEFIQRSGDFRVWRIQDGKRRWIKTADAFNRLEFSWERITSVSDTEFASYPEGAPIE